MNSKTRFLTILTLRTRKLNCFQYVNETSIQYSTRDMQLFLLILRGNFTQYFSNLESHNYMYASKIIPKIEKENGDIITDQTEILDETHNYYQHLYNANTKLNDVDLNEYLPNSNNLKLNVSDSKKLQGEITSAEATFTQKNMKNNRSPGSSGFSCEFFKCLWKQLGSFVVRSIIMHILLVSYK